MNLERNKTQLLKALDSPFATGPLTSQLGREGNGQITEKILDGTIDPIFIKQVDQSKEMTNFICALKRPINKAKGAPV